MSSPKIITLALSLLIPLSVIARADVRERNKDNITTPLPMPVVLEVEDDSEDTAEADGVSFDRTGAEGENTSASGVSFGTILIFIIPIMAVVNLFAFRALKNNQVEDFVPAETDEDN